MGETPCPQWSHMGAVGSQDSGNGHKAANVDAI